MSKKYKILTMAAIVVLLGTWFFWFRHYQDRQKFERIEAGVEELTQRIASEFDLEVTSQNTFCRKEARKFEREPLNCIVSRVFAPSEKVFEEIIEYILLQSDLVEDDPFNSRFVLAEDNAYCRIAERSADLLYPIYLSNPHSDPNDELIYYYCAARATESHYRFIR